jgi:hypothetical protein
MISAITNYHKTTTDAVAAPAASTTSAASSASQANSQSAFADFMAVFGGSSGSSGSSTPAAAATPAAQPAAATDVPTAQSVFGDQPWMSNPQGSAADGTTWNYNPIYFASASTAAQVAAMVGGKVIQQEAITSTGNSTLEQTTLNNMVQMPDGGVINPGLVADFYDHGYSQSMINQMIANEVQGA